MSLFKTLQHQQRVVSLFTHDLQKGPGKLLFTQLTKKAGRDKFKLEVHTTFPTMGQLEYLKTINTPMLTKQIPNLVTICKRNSYDTIFGSSLSHCVTKGEWNSSMSIWVDWEHKKMGSTLNG